MKLDCCPTCPSLTNPNAYGPVSPSGPIPCRVMFIGEGPARDEVRWRRPFAGRTGRELDGLYLPLAGLSRQDVYVTNAHKCPRPHFKNPTKEEAQSCSAYHLQSEILRVQPEVIVPMGAVACSLFGDQIHLESQHGIAFEGNLYHWSGWVFPTYHPSIGLHEGSWMQIMEDDFLELALFLSGIQPHRDDQHPSPDYRELDTLESLEAVIVNAAERGLLGTCAIDTEATPLARTGSISQRWNPYCLSFSFRPGTGYTIYRDRPGVLSEFTRAMAIVNPLWLIHNALFDLDILRLMGVPIQRFDDTMIRAYNLQRIPRGLKPLAYRLCGMRMSDFEDIVTPYSREVVLDWTANAYSDLQEIMFDPYGKSGKLLKAPRHLPDYTAAQYRTYNKLGKILNDWNECDPWSRWWDWHQHDREFLSEFFGPMPSKSIAHCPRSVSTPYACADADATIRVLPELKRLALYLRSSVEVS